MKIKKKTAMVLGMTLGIFMFSATATAEVASKSGYQQLKDSIKYSAKCYTGTISNYSFDSSFVVKDGNTTLLSENMTSKYDMKNQVHESIEQSQDKKHNAGEKITSYFYRDKKGYITQKSQNDSYYVSNEKMQTKFLQNPFDDEKAGDIEKIADSIIGNLKDAVVVEKHSDGKITFSGSLSGTQIPSVVNALTSYQLKNMSNQASTSLPKLSSEIYLKNIRGNADANRGGLINKAFLSFDISGKTSDGVSHTLNVQFLVKAYDINSTSIKRPDLSGKQVIEDNGPIGSTAYVGKYSSNILIKKDNKFVKIGERIITITNMDKSGASGEYHEYYKKGYESYADKSRNFKFTGKPAGNGDNSSIRITTTPSSEGSDNFISIDPNAARIFMNTNLIDDSSNGVLPSDGSFERVFD